MPDIRTPCCRMNAEVAPGLQGHYFLVINKLAVKFWLHRFKKADFFFRAGELIITDERF